MADSHDDRASHLAFHVDGTIWADRDEQARRAFERLVEGCESNSLARMALQIAVSEYPALLVEAVLSRLEEIAQQIRTGLPPDATDTERIEALNIQLFEVMSFWGDGSELYDLRSCYLNDVLNRRLGLPVTLSILYFDLAQRLGLNISIVSLPGHFVIRYAGRDGHGELFVDPYRRGTVFDRQQCQTLLSRLTRGRVPWSDEYLRPVDKRHMLTCHLNDLKAAYQRLNDRRRVLRVQNYLLTLHPDNPHLYRDRGLLWSELDLKRAAVDDLEAYLRLAANAPDADRIGELLEELRST